MGEGCGQAQLVGWLEYILGRRELLRLCCGLLWLPLPGRMDVYLRGVVARLWVVSSKHLGVFFVLGLKQRRLLYLAAPSLTIAFPLPAKGGCTSCLYIGARLVVISKLRFYVVLNSRPPSACVLRRRVLLLTTHTPHPISLPPLLCFSAAHGRSWARVVGILQSLVISPEFQHILRILNTNIDGRRKVREMVTSHNALVSPASLRRASSVSSCAS